VELSDERANQRNERPATRPCPRCRGTMGQAQWPWPCSSRGTLLVKGISLLNTTLTRTGFPTEFKEWSKLAQDPESWRARVWPG